MTIGRCIDGTIVIDKGSKPARNRFFAFLPIALVLSVIGSSVSAIGLVSEVMDATDAGLTVGGGTTGLAFTAPVLILAQVVSAIILFGFWRLALRSTAGPSGLLSKSGRIIGLILLAAGVALTLVVFGLQVSIDAREHAVAFASLRALQAFCSIGLAAATVGIFWTFTSPTRLRNRRIIQ